MGISSHRRVCRTACVTLRVERLLDRYPKLSQDEFAELKNLMPLLPILDYALLLADCRLASKLERLQDDGARPGPSTSMSLLAMVAIALGITCVSAMVIRT